MKKNAVEPDIVFVSAARGGIIGPEYIVGAPDLVVEILSPHRPDFDRVTKVKQYARHGVGEHWIIDPVEENVEVYRLVNSAYDLKADLAGGDSLATPLLPGWKLAVQDLFSD